MSASAPRVEHRRLSAQAIANIRAMAPHGCLTARRILALAVPDQVILEDRVQCPFHPAGPGRDHDFTERCVACGGPRCRYCDCHVQ